MDWRLIAGITVFALILMFSGETAYEKKQREEELKYKGQKDPLMRAIMDYQNEKPNSKAARGTGKPEAGSSYQRRDSYQGQSTQYPDHMIPYQNRRGTWQLQKDRQQYMQQPNGGNTINNNNYYPPPPVNDDSRKGSSNQIDIKPIPVGEGHKFLRGGQPIAYDGTKVFLIDQQGNRKRMPDGRYRTADGLELQIVGGRQFVGSN